MVEPSITSISSAQADGQSCGQVECRMSILLSILACWFRTRQISPKNEPAERIYPAKRVVRHASCAEIGPAIGVDRLPCDVARVGTTQESHRRGNILGLAALAGDG